jgi:hypothetical protein
MNIGGDLKLKVEIAMVEIHLLSQTQIQISPNNIHINIGFYEIDGTFMKIHHCNNFLLK